MNAYLTLPIDPRAPRLLRWQLLCSVASAGANSSAPGSAKR